VAHGAAWRATRYHNLGTAHVRAGSAAWWAAVKQFRPDLVSAFNPWERIVTPQAVSQLLADSGIREAEITAEDGHQALQSPDDWWTVVQGSGYRWTLEQMDYDTLARVRDTNLETLRKSDTKLIETNVIYATATRA
jgi:hypothetical protein